MVLIVWQNRARLFTPILRQKRQSDEKKKSDFKFKKKNKQILARERKKWRIIDGKEFFANRSADLVCRGHRSSVRSDAISSIQTNENETENRLWIFIKSYSWMLFNFGINFLQVKPSEDWRIFCEE